MPEKLVTPVDELTGIPLAPIYRKVIPIGDPENGNEHHAWHPGDAPLFEANTLAARALRNSTIWLVDPKDHNMAVKGKDRPGYHDLFAGPQLPKTEQEIFEICLFANSGARSRFGIDLHRGAGADEPVPLKDKQWDIMSTPARPPILSPSNIIKIHASAGRAYDKLIEPNVDKETYMSEFVEHMMAKITEGSTHRYHHIYGGFGRTQKFFTDYIARQEIGHIKESVVDEFIVTEDLERRRHLGYYMLGQAIEVVTDPMESRYAQVRQEGRLHPLVPEFAKHKAATILGTQKHWDALVETLHVRFSEEVNRVAA